MAATKADYEGLKSLLGITALRPGRNGGNPNATTNQPNYEESKANPFPKLPDPLVTKSGAKVETAEQWWKVRRPEIVEDFDREVYGRVPASTPAVKWQVTHSFRTNYAGISVIHKILTGTVDNQSFPSVSVQLQASLTVPATSSNPVPAVLQLAFPASFPSALGTNPAAIPTFTYRTAEGGTNSVPVWQHQVLSRGWGYAILSPNSVQPDQGGALTSGIIGLCNQGKPRKVDDWGVLRAWAWGASRLLDYLETDASIDSKHVAIGGHSRYGKAALVAMAYDSRFATAFISSSGAAGAKLHRRDYGETVENVAAMNEYHWMAGNYLKYAGPLTWNDLPVDSHELVALCAPRPVFLSAGSVRGDNWVDAKGTFLAGVGASPVYQLLGKKGFSTMEFPKMETLVEGDVGFRQHHGGHVDAPNWSAFLDFAAQHLGLKGSVPHP